MERCALAHRRAVVPRHVPRVAVLQRRRTRRSRRRAPPRRAPPGSRAGAPARGAGRSRSRRRSRRGNGTAARRSARGPTSRRPRRTWVRERAGDPNGETPCATPCGRARSIARENHNGKKRLFKDGRVIIRPVWPFRQSVTPQSRSPKTRDLRFRLRRTSPSLSTRHSRCAWLTVDAVSFAMGAAKTKVRSQTVSRCLPARAVLPSPSAPAPPLRVEISRRIVASSPTARPTRSPPDSPHIARSGPRRKRTPSARAWRSTARASGGSSRKTRACPRSCTSARTWT